MASEKVTSLLNRYLQRANSDIKYFGDDTIGDKLTQLFSSPMTDFEAPDAFITLPDSLVILEHFEFDSTKSTRKGSANKNEEARIDRNFKQAAAEKEELTLYDEINCNHSANYYIENIRSGFLNHKDKIPQYKDNIIKAGIATDGTNFLTGFIIEDTTSLGNAIDPIDFGAKERPAIVAHCKQFLDLLESSKEVNFCICLSYYGNQHFIWYVDQENIAEYRKDQFDTEEISLIDFTTQVMNYQTVTKPVEFNGVDNFEA